MPSSTTFIVCLRCSNLIQRGKAPFILVPLSLIISPTNIAGTVDGSPLNDSLMIHLPFRLKEKVRLRPKRQIQEQVSCSLNSVLILFFEIIPWNSSHNPQWNISPSCGISKWNEQSLEALGDEEPETYWLGGVWDDLSVHLRWNEAAEPEMIQSV